MRCKDAHDCDTEAMPGAEYCARHTGSAAAKDAAVVLKLREQKSQILKVFDEYIREVHFSTVKATAAARKALQ